MKKRQYLLSSMLLIMALIFVLTACGPDKPNGDNNSPVNEDFLGTYYIYKTVEIPSNGSAIEYEVSKGTLEKTSFVIILKTGGQAVLSIDQINRDDTYTVTGKAINFSSGYVGRIEDGKMFLSVDTEDGNYITYEFKKESNNEDDVILPSISINGYPHDSSINPTTKTITINETAASASEFNPSNIVIPANSTMVIYKDEAKTQQVIGNLQIEDGVNTFYLTINSQGTTSNWILKITKYSKEENATIVKSIAPSNDIVKEYKLNEEFSENQHFIITFNNGTTKVMLLEKTYITGFSTSSVGEKTIVVKYQEKSFIYTINVIDSKSKIVDSSVLSSCNLKENVSNFGQLTVEEYGEKKTIDITPDMVTGFDSSKAGYQEILVTYKGNTIKCGIVVNQLNIEEITPTTPVVPDKDTYQLFKEICAHVNANLYYPNKDLTDSEYRQSYEEFLASDGFDVNPFVDLISKMGITNEELDENGALRKLIIKGAAFTGVTIEKTNAYTDINTFVNMDYISECQNIIKDIVAYFDKEKIGILLYNLDGVVRFNENLLYYDRDLLESFYNTPYRDKIERQIKLREDSFTNYYQILSYSETVQIGEIALSILTNLTKLPTQDLVNYIEYIYNTATMTDPMDLIQKISFKDSIKAINFTGTVVDAVASAISGQSQIIQEMALKIVNEIVYDMSPSDNYLNIVKTFIIKTSSNLNNINALTYLLKNVTLEDFTTIALDVDDLLKTPAANPPSENATQQEKEEYERKLTKVQAKYGILIIDSAKIVNRLISTMPELLRDMAFEVTEFILNAAAQRYPEFDCTLNKEAIISAADRFAKMDPSTMSDKDLQGVVTEFIQISEKLVTIPPTSEYNILLHGNVPLIRVGATEEELIDIMMETLTLEINNNGFSLSNLGRDSFSISGFSSLTEGVHEITFEIGVNKTKMKYYVFDQTTKSKLRNIFIYYQLSTDVNQIFKYDTPLNEDNILNNMINPTRNNEISYCIYQTGISCRGKITSYKLVGFNKEAQDVSTAAIIVHEEILGDIYIPFKYQIINMA